ncbi:MAG: response regulator [Anaerolineae bacterium]|nr:response regulator [Anaerolineae bacterium]
MKKTKSSPLGLVEQKLGLPGQRRVLIVDDDIDFADSLHDLLEAEDYLTKIANNSNDALLEAKAFVPDVALLDIRLGQASGLDLLTILKQKYPPLLCIIMTAYANVENAVRALQYGAYDYLRKPIFPEELTATLNRCFEKIELEQKNQQAFVALQASEERYRSIFENALEGIFRYKPGEGFIDANPALVQMLGYGSKAEVLALNLEKEVYVHADQFQSVLDQIQARKMIKSFELVWQKKNGKHITINLNGRVIQNAQGEVLFCEGMVQDISERKQAEEEIYRRNRELDLLNRVIAATATSSDTATILDTVCRELALAFDVPQATAILLNQDHSVVTIVAGYQAKDQPIALLNKSIPIKNPSLVQDFLTGKTPLVVEDVKNDPRLASFRDLFQQYHTASLLVLPLIVDQEMVGSLNINTLKPRSFSHEEISLARRVAEQVTGALLRVRLDEQGRQLEDQLRQSQKMEAIGRLAGGLAHDFNNLLTVITGYSELLLNRHLDKNDPQYRDVEQIHKAGERASTLIRQLLAFSRQQVIQPVVLDLNVVITDLNKMLRRLVSEDIELITHLDPSSGRVKADAGQVEQIIMNLVVNAADAMPQGGKLTIETSQLKVDKEYAGRHIGLKPGMYIMLTISDTGIGMDEETRSHIFEPFFTTKEKDKGTGLGLATVYGIVQQNQGYISVTSRVGQGTTFQIYLPRLRQAAEVTDSDQALAQSQKGTETILLVEDDDMVRELARQALRQDGYQILEARNGREALKVCEQANQTIHLLLTDVVMPGGLNGHDVAQHLRAIHPEIKVLYMSGYVDEAIAQYGILDAGATFLQKPFSPVALSLKVREVLDA